MKQFTIDRIEENKAVLECENGDCVSLELSSLPKNIKEGDVLCFEEGSYFLDAAETQKRKEHIKNLMNSLFE
jgi:hypothetical protein